jgi:hypothetical protein
MVEQKPNRLQQIDSLPLGFTNVFEVDLSKNKALVFVPDVEVEKQNILELQYRKLEEFPFLMEMFSFTLLRINNLRTSLGFNPVVLGVNQIRILDSNYFEEHIDPDAEGAWYKNLNTCFIKYSERNFSEEIFAKYLLTHEMIHAGIEGINYVDTKIGQQLDEGITELITFDILKTHCHSTPDHSINRYWQTEELLEEMQKNSFRSEEYKKVKLIQKKSGNFREFLTAAVSGDSDKAIEIYKNCRKKS